MELKIINTRIIRFLLGLFWSFLGIQMAAAQDLSALLDLESPEEPAEVQALFKSTRIVNGHSVKQMKKGELDYRISHRFGELKTGGYELFGLDHSTIHLSLEFGPTDWLMVGVGRGSFQKTVDGFVKLRITEQGTRSGTFPFSSAWVSSLEWNTLKWTNPDRENLLSSRFSYAHQLLIARKMGKLTVQFMPILLHRNLVPLRSDLNNQFAIGIGGRYKLNQRFALTAEYYYVFHPSSEIHPSPHPLSLGFDIETGGHVFQLAFTNSLGMREGALLTQDAGNWLLGGIRFGFNISRVFTLY